MSGQSHKSEGEPQPLLRVAVGGADLVSVVPEHAVAAAGNGQEPQEWPRKYLGQSWKRKIFDTRQTFIYFIYLFVYLFIYINGEVEHWCNPAGPGNQPLHPLHQGMCQ